MAAQATRARTEIRRDSGWGRTEILEWLLARGYHVTGTFKSNARVRKLVGAGAPTAWQPTTSPGREVAPIPTPVACTRPLAQYAVRTPSVLADDGYYHAVLFTSRTEMAMQEVVTHYDGRAAMEADLKGDKRGLGLAVIRKRRFPAQTMVVLLTALAHNLLVWSRHWLTARVPRVRELGIVRLIQELWAVPGRVKLVADGLSRVRFRAQHPRAREALAALPLLGPGQTLALWP